MKPLTKKYKDLSEYTLKELVDLTIKFLKTEDYEMCAKIEKEISIRGF